MDLKISNPLRRLLIVDDDVHLSEMYKSLFETHNHIVTTMHNGVDALRYIMKNDVDAVLCDLMMPHMCGDMFYTAVERVKPTLCERFIFVTGYEGHPQFADFLKKVNAVVLYKPVTIGKLLGTLSCLADRLAKRKKKVL
jgi:two-component system, cell cycle sensor histidine kinase and response regulator CckA